MATKPGIEIQGTPDAQTITAVSRTIRTLDQLLEACEVDLDTWEVEKYTANKWDMAAKTHKDVDKDTGSYTTRLTTTELWQVKATLKRKINYNFDIAMSRVLKRLEASSPKLPTPKRPRGRKPRLVDWQPYDTHFGKLAWAPEAGHDYDLSIAKTIFQNAAVDLLDELAGDQVDRFHMAVGNDFFHIDNHMATTTGGTHMDADGRYPKIIEYGFLGLVQSIILFNTVAPVDITWVPGNHDYQSSYHICRELDAYFRNTPSVNVNISPNPRKYYQYGNCLLGYTHGKDEKPQALPTIMAVEQPELWAKCHTRVWNLGHIHTKKVLTTTDINEYNGVMVSWSPSLAGTDLWHHSKGYVGNKRAAQAVIYDKVTGYHGHKPIYARV